MHLLFSLWDQKEKNVTEDMKLEPLTDYSKFKAECEKILNNYKSDDFITTTIRPSTVCGFAKDKVRPSCQYFTNHAFHNRSIKSLVEINCPNVHIDDMVDSYQAIISASSDKIKKFLMLATKTKQ